MLPLPRRRSARAACESTRTTRASSPAASTSPSRCRPSSGGCCTRTPKHSFVHRAEWSVHESGAACVRGPVRLQVYLAGVGAGARPAAYRLPLYEPSLKLLRTSPDLPAGVCLAARRLAARQRPLCASGTTPALGAWLPFAPSRLLTPQTVNRCRSRSARLPPPTAPPLAGFSCSAWAACCCRRPPRLLAGEAHLPPCSLTH